MEIQNQNSSKRLFWIIGLIVVLIFIVYKLVPLTSKNQKLLGTNAETKNIAVNLEKEYINEYQTKLNSLANISNATNSTTSVLSLWPASKNIVPKQGAILPFNRVIAFYGNLYSKGMGILGEYSQDVVLEKLLREVKNWEEADPSTPVIPALHYIAVVAQKGAGKDGKYRARMPDSEIEKVFEMANKINGIVFLDIQAGLSNIQEEIKHLEKHLKNPNVHLGIDPEFYMKNGGKPGERIGSLDAIEINFAIEYLSELINKNNLPPKVLIVHRFTKPMLTNFQNIKPTSEVQVVINMDGFGAKGNKLNTYQQYIYKEPVQFTGFKIFYKNDSKSGRTIFSPEELLKLSPIPIYIQYQ